MQGSAVSGRGHFQDRFPCPFDRHGHFTLNHLRLSVLNETHTNFFTGSVD